MPQVMRYCWSIKFPCCSGVPPPLSLIFSSCLTSLPHRSNSFAAPVLGRTSRFGLVQARITSALILARTTSAMSNPAT